MTPSHRESPAWQRSLAQALVEDLPRLIGEPADARLEELLSALAAALCQGELWLDLEGEAPEGVSAAHWPEGHRRALTTSALARDPDGPLALVGHRLAWRRWQWRRQEVLAALVERASGGGGEEPGDSEDLGGLDGEQRRAVRAALAQGLVLILGGPGTGKTSTVGQLLAALRRRHPDARVHLAAPTGKAAARLRAATGGRETCTTLHRLLESRGDGFGRNRHRPLALDLLVIDEVSMVDLELMGAVLEALPASCRLVLVGDPAQLPPIAPGSLLLALQDDSVTDALVRQCIHLRTTYRNAGAIARVADALRSQLEGKASPAATALGGLRPLLLQLGEGENLSWREVTGSHLPRALLERLTEHQRRLAELAADCWPDGEGDWASLLAERDRLLVLSPLRRGRWGIDAIHRALLPTARRSTAGEAAPWPCGTPLLCRRNLPALGLANGDIGVLVERGGERGPRRLLFGQEAPLWLHPAQLAGALEPALALTVHKAQGSEAREVILLLEEARAPDPRLLYTALTRARETVLLFTASAGSQTESPAPQGISA